MSANDGSVRALDHVAAWASDASGPSVYVITAKRYRGGPVPVVRLHPYDPLLVARGIADRAVDGLVGPTVCMRHLSTPTGRIPTIVEMLDEHVLRTCPPLAGVDSGQALRTVADAAMVEPIIVVVHDLDEYLNKVDDRDHDIVIRELLRLTRLDGDPRLLVTCFAPTGERIRSLLRKSEFDGVTLVRADEESVGRP